MRYNGGKKGREWGIVGKKGREWGIVGDIEGIEICGFELYSISHCRYFVSSFEEGHSVIKTIPANEDVLIKQLMSHSRPLVGHMTEDNQLSVYHNRPLLVSYMDLSWDLHAKST